MRCGAVVSGRTGIGARIWCLRPNPQRLCNTDQQAQDAERPPVQDQISSGLFEIRHLGRGYTTNLKAL